MQPDSQRGVLHLKNFLRYFGVDRAIFFTLLSRVWGLFSGPITIYLIARFLSREEQGYFYTFGSILGLRVFFELGLGYVIMQSVSHEMAHLQWAEDGTLSGDPVAKSRLASLFRFALKCYGCLALIGACLLLPAGLWFFGKSSEGAVLVIWRAPWLIVVCMACFDLMLTPFYGFMEGCGKVAEYAKRGAWMAIISSLCFWICLIFGGKLFAAPLQNATCAVIGAFWVFVKYGRCFKDILATPILPGAVISWKDDIFHFQWKIALSSLSGYFIFQLINPVLFRYKGPAEAGRMGMSMKMIDTLTGFAYSWVSTKAAPFGTYIARREFQRLDDIFRQASRQSIGVTLTGGLALFAGYFALRQYGVALAFRFLDPIPFFFLYAGGVVNCIIFCQAIYLRAHREEPLLINSLVGAALVPIAVLTFGPRYGASGIAIALFCLNIFVGLPWATWVFITKRKQWHRFPSELENSVETLVNARH